MKIAAVTMVYRDYWALSQWYRHFGGMIGPEHLVVIAHGRDDEIKRICPDASVLVIPREDLTGFDRVRWRFMNRLKDTLYNVYDRVICTDADELICLDPKRFTSLQDVFEQYDEPALFALGLDVVELDGDLWSVFNGHYSKAWTARERVQLVMHGARSNGPLPFVMPQGVYLAHLKHANASALHTSNVHRMAIASGAERGLPGKAWQIAGVRADQMAERTARHPVVTWEQASQAAYDALAHDPKRLEDKNLLRAQFLNFQTKSEVPPWILQPDQ